MGVDSFQDEAANFIEKPQLFEHQFPLDGSQYLSWNSFCRRVAAMEKNCFLIDKLRLMAMETYMTAMQPNHLKKTLFNNYRFRSPLNGLITRNMKQLSFGKQLGLPDDNFLRTQMKTFFWMIFSLQHTSPHGRLRTTWVRPLFAPTNRELFKLSFRCSTVMRWYYWLCGMPVSSETHSSNC